jgi:hypothetical protein
MKKTDKARRGRRNFTKALAASLVAAPAALSAASAQTTTPAPEAKAPPNPQPTPTPQQPQPSPTAAAYAEVARARFGQQLTPDEMARVRRDLEGNVRAADRLRAHKLANADEPDFAFEA